MIKLGNYESSYYVHTNHTRILSEREKNAYVWSLSMLNIVYKLYLQRQSHKFDTL